MSDKQNNEAKNENKSTVVLECIMKDLVGDICISTRWVNPKVFSFDLTGKREYVTEVSIIDSYLFTYEYDYSSKDEALQQHKKLVEQFKLDYAARERLKERLQADKILLKNVLAFLCIICGEDDGYEKIIYQAPQYILEKYKKYCLSEKNGTDDGMHPVLKKEVFDRYCEIWRLDNEL